MEFKTRKQNKFNEDLFNKLTDTNCFFIKNKIIDINNNKNKFIENENILLEKNKPVIKFFRNGEILFFDNLNSFNKLENPIKGIFRVYNDTIEVMREYYSVQAGKFHESSFFIFEDSIIVEKNFPKDNGINVIYKKEYFDFNER